MDSTKDLPTSEPRVQRSQHTHIQDAFPSAPVPTHKAEQQNTP